MILSKLPFHCYVPSLEDDLAIHENNIIIMCTNVQFDNVAFFNLSFDGVINSHIKHEHYKGMLTKSDVVSTCIYVPRFLGI